VNRHLPRPSTVLITNLGPREAATYRKSLRVQGFVKIGTGWGRGTFWTTWRKGSVTIEVIGSPPPWGTTASNHYAVIQR
jgi:hypothetical protein